MANIDEILDLYEKDCNEDLLKERVDMASDEVLFGKNGLFYYLSEADNGLPQLLRINYKLRYSLLVIMMMKKLKKE